LDIGGFSGCNSNLPLISLTYNLSNFCKPSIKTYHTNILHKLNKITIKEIRSIKIFKQIELFHKHVINKRINLILIIFNLLCLI
jgi:hypothetical protein